MQRFLLTLTLATAVSPRLVHAGPPLICQHIDIGSARSLPWLQTSGWNGADPKYDMAKLTGDTLGLLAPGTPVKVRMETLRRAAIYAAKSEGLASELTARLSGRALDSEASGKRDALAWFDAGYWVETLRQVSFIYRYDMLSERERAEWRIRKSPHGLDGYPWVKRAVELGGQGMGPALERIAEYREADLRTANAAASAPAQTR